MLALLATLNDHTEVYVATVGQVIATIITTAGLTAGAIIAAGIPGRRKSRKKQDAIHEQVANTHETNLRDDVDGIRNAISDVLSVLKRLVARVDRTSGDIGAVKSGLAAARGEIAALNERLDNHIDGR